MSMKIEPLVRIVRSIVNGSVPSTERFRISAATVSPMSWATSTHRSISTSAATASARSACSYSE